MPHPRINHAGGRFIQEYLTRLSRHAAVQIVAPRTPENELAAAYCDEVLRVHLFPIGELWLRALRTLRRAPVEFMFGLTPGTLMQTPLSKDSEAMRLMEAADIVEIQFAQYLPLLEVMRPRLPRARFTVHEHDVFSQYAKEALRLPQKTRRRLISSVRARRMPKVEASLLNQCDLIITHNPKDRDLLLHDLGVLKPVEFVYPPVTIPAEPAAIVGETQVCFVGAMWRIENQAAVEWMLEWVWPLVRSKVEGATLVVAGDGPPRWLMERAGKDGLTVTGFRASLDPVYASSSVSVVPAIGGAGIKVKSLQAMAFGLPVVSTRAGAQGIVAGSGVGVFGAIADDPVEFSDAVARLLMDPDEARQVGGRARAWVLENCDFDAAVDRIAGLYQALLEPPAPAR